MIPATHRPLRELPPQRSTCPWCGIERNSRPDRHTTMCRDCKQSGAYNHLEEANS